MKKILFLLIFCLVLISGCSHEINNPGETLNLGGVALRIDKQNVPSNVVTVEAYLTREGYDEMYGVLDILSETSAEILFEEVAVGMWHLVVNAKNEMGFVVYTGETDVEITEGTLTQVNLTLVPTGNGFGRVYIYVTWGGKSVWKDYEGNPLCVSPDSLSPTAQAKVIFDEGKFKMWYEMLYNGGRADIWYAESNDGINWNTIGNEPVLTWGEYGSWDDYSITPAAVLKDGEQYKLYYTGMKETQGMHHTGLAISNDGIHFEKISHPVLSPDSTEYQISTTDVIKVQENLYYLYYNAGTNFQMNYRIHMARSADGIVWEKYSNNPILTADSEWEGSYIGYSSVINDGSEFKMVYMCQRRDAFGMAKSPDGKNWSKLSGNPVFIMEDISVNKPLSINYPFFRKFGNEYRIYYTGDQNGLVKIRLATKYID